MLCLWSVDIKSRGIANDLWSKNVYHRFSHCILYTSILVSGRKFHHTYLTRYGRCTRWHHLRCQCTPFTHFTVTYISHLHTSYIHIHCTFTYILPLHTLYICTGCMWQLHEALDFARAKHPYTTWTNIFSMLIYLRGGGAGLSRFTHTTLSVTCQAWQPGGQPYCTFSGSIQ